QRADQRRPLLVDLRQIITGPLRLPEPRLKEDARLDEGVRRQLEQAVVELDEVGPQVSEEVTPPAGGQPWAAAEEACGAGEPVADNADPSARGGARVIQAEGQNL